MKIDKDLQDYGILQMIKINEPADFPGMLAAACDIFTVGQAEEALDSGVKIIISPGINEKIIRYCGDNNMAVIPGCATANDIERALDLGIGTVSFFPAENAGGVNMLSALGAAYPHVKFVPAGGIDDNNFLDYLYLKSVLAAGGSFTGEAVDKMLGFKTAGMIITAESADRADMQSARLADIFGFSRASDENFATVDGALKFAKVKHYGRDGSFIVETNFLERAVFYLKRRGIEFIDESARYDAGGALSLIYLDCMISGFAVRLEQRA